ncbi:MAG: hypothetical protein ACOVN9_03195 [Inhella sp.]
MDELKVGALLRDAGDNSIVLRKAAESGRATLSFSASSEEPYERWFGIEVLDHGKGAVRMARFERGAVPLLFNHNWDDPIGMVKSASVRNGRLMIDEAELFSTARSAEVERVFADLKTWLPGLIRDVQAKQANETVIRPTGSFSKTAQRELGFAAMKLMGFDFEAGRLDESAHPFCGGVPEDVRMTTRYSDHDPIPALMGVIHETGHGRYEQNLPREWLGLPVANARSMGLHESQSLSFEMQLGSHPGFAKLLSPLVQKHLGSQPAFEPDNLHKLLTRVQPGFIRVDADEVTYPAHVILRFEIERALMEGQIEAADVPALWNEKMQQLLGISTEGNYQNGCMQDVHWPSGLFGYFPCYTLGAMYASQWFATMRRELPGLDAGIERGELKPVFDWLNAKVWSQGSRWETPELVRRASGETLNPAHFQAHLRARYLG